MESALNGCILNLYLQIFRFGRFVSVIRPQQVNGLKGYPSWFYMLFFFSTLKIGHRSLITSSWAMGPKIQIIILS